MFKKKLILKRILTMGMAASLLVPTSVYAAEGIDSNQIMTTAADITKIIKDYQGNYWIPVENGYARCDEQGTVLAGYEVAAKIPVESEQPEDSNQPTEPEQAENPKQPTEPEQPTQPEQPIEPEQPENPEPSTEPKQPENPEPSENPEQAVESGQAENLEPSEDFTQEEDKISTNEELIASQQIVIPPQVEETYRFIKVEKQYAVAKEDEVIIYEDNNDEARAVGTLQAEGLCYILADEEQEWIFVESGAVRGFVKAQQLLVGEEAKTIVDEKKEIHMYFAEELIAPFENAALTYTLTTVRDTVVDKVYAISAGDIVNVREGATKDARVVGQLPEGALCYILADGNQEWAFVESENVRGFVSTEFLLMGEEAAAIVAQTGEENLGKAQEKVAPKENKAFYYTITSTIEASKDDAVREAMLTYAQQFIGNPYVWGGTSLTTGADCSGFVQGIYRAFGYSIPRVSRDQAVYGMQIPVEEAKPGDLIFYAKNGVVYHVVMYAGNGKTVEAQSSRTGIVNSHVQYGNAVWATRVIHTENEVYEKPDVTAEPYTEYTPAAETQIGESLGNYEISTYCDCSLCCGQWSGEVTDLNTMPVEGRTVSASDIPIGTCIIIDGNIYVVEDDDAAPGQIKIYVDSHENCENTVQDKYQVFSVKNK